MNLSLLLEHGVVVSNIKEMFFFNVKLRKKGVKNPFFF